MLANTEAHDDNSHVLALAPLSTSGQRISLDPRLIPFDRLRWRRRGWCDIRYSDGPSNCVERFADNAIHVEHNAPFYNADAIEPVQRTSACDSRVTPSSGSVSAHDNVVCGWRGISMQRRHDNPNRQRNRSDEFWRSDLWKIHERLS